MKLSSIVRVTVGNDRNGTISRRNREVVTVTFPDNSTRKFNLAPR